MTNILNVYKKELRYFFTTAVAYLITILFLLLSSISFFFLSGFLRQDYASLRSYFGLFPIIFAIFIPAFSMGIWTNEKEGGTYDLLSSLPFKEIEIVIGKYLAIMSIILILLLLTVFVPAGLTVLGDFDIGEIIGEYIGVFFLGAAYTAIGMLISFLSRKQITAFLISLSVLIGLSLVGLVNQLIELPSILRDLLHYISIDSHFDSFSKGMIDSRDILYFSSIAFVCLYLNIKIMILKKWG